MTTSRRKFLKTTAAAGGAVGLGALPSLTFGASDRLARRLPCPRAEAR